MFGNSQALPRSYVVTSSIALGTAIVVFFLVSAGEPLTIFDVLVASSIVLMLLFYSTQYLIEGPDHFPFLPYALLHFSVFFALPAIWPMTTDVAALAMPGMLWCSASQ